MPATLTTGQDKFKRILRNIEGQYSRLNGTTITGRNSEASAATAKYNLKQLWNLISADDSVAEMIDADEKLAARFNKAERNYWLYF